MKYVEEIPEEWKAEADFDHKQFSFPASICGTIQRPDLVIWSPSSRRVILVELTCPAEEGIQNATNRKQKRYADLQLLIRQHEWTPHLFTIEVGARGFVAKSTLRFLSSLGFSRRSSSALSKNLSNVSARCSYAIFNAQSSPHWDSKRSLLEPPQRKVGVCKVLPLSESQSVDEPSVEHKACTTPACAPLTTRLSKTPNQQRKLRWRKNVVADIKVVPRLTKLEVCGEKGVDNWVYFAKKRRSMAALAGKTIAQMCAMEEAEESKIPQLSDTIKQQLEQKRQLALARREERKQRRLVAARRDPPISDAAKQHLKQKKVAALARRKRKAQARRANGNMALKATRQGTSRNHEDAVDDAQDFEDAQEALCAAQDALEAHFLQDLEDVEEAIAF